MILLITGVIAILMAGFWVITVEIRLETMKNNIDIIVKNCPKVQEKEPDYE